MLVYSRKWVQLRRNQIPLLRFWHNLQCNSGLLLAKHVLVFLPQEVRPSPNCRSNRLPVALRTATSSSQSHGCTKDSAGNLVRTSCRQERSLVWALATPILFILLQRRYYGKPLLQRSVSLDGVTL